MARTALDEQTRLLTRNLMKVLEGFREQDGEMPVQQMLVLLWIASNEGKTQRELIAALSMAPSTSSRNIAALSEVHRLGKPGLGLVTWSDHPTDRRIKLLMLTPKGKAFITRLLSDL